MKRKIINISVWISLVFGILGLLLGSFEIHFSNLLLLLSVASSQLIFIPLFFFLKDKQIDKHYKKALVKPLQGVSFFVIGIAPIFNLLHWPGAISLSLLSILATILLGITLYYIRNPKFRRPHIIAFMVLLLMGGLTKPIGELSRNSLQSGIIPFSESIEQLKENRIAEFEKHGGKSSDSLYKEGIYLNNHLEKVITELKRLSERVPTEVAKSIHLKDLTNKESSVISTHLLIGVDANNPHGLENEFSATTLKVLLNNYSNSRLNNYFVGTSTIHQFQFDSANDIGKIKWENIQFNQLPLGYTIVNLQLYQLFIWTEMSLEQREINGNHNPELNTERRAQVIIKFKEYTNNLVQTMGEMNQKKSSFIFIMALTWMVVVFLFFIPSFPISDIWKIRILLFFVIIIFEFILLLTDSYIGIFSQNPMLLLGVNIVLALGLVALDGFLRTNFLKWFEE